MRPYNACVYYTYINASKSNLLKHYVFMDLKWPFKNSSTSSLNGYVINIQMKLEKFMKPPI